MLVAMVVWDLGYKLHCVSCMIEALLGHGVLRGLLVKFPLKATILRIFATITSKDTILITLPTLWKWADHTTKKPFIDCRH